MVATPGNGARLERLLGSSISMQGVGLMDAMLAVFLVEGLRGLGASGAVALGSLAGGAALSVLFAPFAAAIGAIGLFWRQTVTYFLLLVAILCVAAIGVLLGDYSVTADGPRDDPTRVIIVVALGVLYRTCTQSAPVVPLAMDAGLVQGDMESFPKRRNLCLSGLYVNYRIGFLVINIAISCMHKSVRESRVMLFLIGGGSAAFTSLVAAMLIFPRPNMEEQDVETEKLEIYPEADGEERTLAILYLDNTVDLTTTLAPDFTVDPGAEGAGEETIIVDAAGGGNADLTTLAETPKFLVVRKAFADIRTVLMESNRRIFVVYGECFFYGMAFGQFTSILAPWYNEVVFGKPPGSGAGVTWASYTVLMGWGVGMLHDLVVPSLLFGELFKRLFNEPKDGKDDPPYSVRGMQLFWSMGLAIGGGLLIGLAFVEAKIPGLVVTGFLSLPQAIHGFFSLVATGGLVEPRLRAAAFSVRALSINLGWLLGSIIGAIVVDSHGFRTVILISGGASFAASLFAFFAGNVPAPSFAGVAVNANSLISFAFEGCLKFASCSNKGTEMS